MSTIIPPITTPDISTGTETTLPNGSIDSSGTVLEGIKPGSNLQITLPSLSQGNLNLSVKIEINNQTLEIPLKLNSNQIPQPNALEAGELPAEIKVLNNHQGELSFKFVSINNQSPEKFIAPNKVPTSGTEALSKPQTAPVIISGNENSVRPEITLHEMSLPKILTSLSGENNLPPEVQNLIADGKLEFAFSKVNSSPQFSQPLPQDTQTALLNLKTALGSGDTKSILSALQSLQGKTFPAITQNRADIGLTSFQTPLGEVVSQTPLKLENNLPIELVVKNITVKTLPTEVLDTLSASAKLLEDMASLPVLNKEQPISSKNILETLKNLPLPPDIKQEVVSKLPTPNKQLLSNLSNFVKAAVHQEVKEWLGPQLSELVLSSGPDGKEALQQLSQSLNATLRETPTWRMVEIPFYTGENIEKIRLAVKKYNEDEEENQNSSRQKYGTRFLIDTNFTRLGRFQFDGYSLVRERRFDLIIRTEKYVGNDLCANLMRIYKNTLYELGYAGTIKINVKENFIKISEDEENKTLSEGILI